MILWKSRWVGGGGGVFEIGNPEGRRGMLKQFWKSRWKGGVPKICLPSGGVCGFFLE